MISICEDPKEIEEYVKLVDEFVPEAVKYTNKKVTINKFSNSEKYNDEWSKIFHRKMDKLTVAARLRYKEV